MEVRAILGLPNTSELQAKLLESDGVTLVADPSGDSSAPLSPDNKTDPKLENDAKEISKRDTKTGAKKDVKNEPSKAVQPLPMSTVAVMAGCHSLAPVDGTIVGDPTEKAAVESVGWNVKTSETTKQTMIKNEDDKRFIKIKSLTPHLSH